MIPSRNLNKHITHNLRHFVRVPFSNHILVIEEVYPLKIVSFEHWITLAKCFNLSSYLRTKYIDPNPLVFVW